MKKVCVLMSSYCGEKFLKEQLDSIRSQEGVMVKLIVRNDGSPDDGKTLKLLNNYKKDHPDFDMSIIDGENLGWAMSFMELVYTSPESDFYAFADQDDIWLPNKLYEAIKMIGDENVPVLYYSNLIYYKKGRCIGTINKPSKNKENKPMALMRNLATGCTIVFNKSLRDLLLLSNGYTIKAHDYFTFLTAVFFGKIYADDKSYILYRQHGSNQVGVSNTSQRAIKEIKTSLNKENDGLHKRESLCKTFFDIYKTQLSQEDLAIVQSIKDYRKRLTNRIKILFNPNIRMESTKSTFILKSRILLGKL